MISYDLYEDEVAMPVNLQVTERPWFCLVASVERDGRQDSGELDVWTVEIAPEGLGRPKVSFGALMHVDSRIYSQIVDT